MINTIRDIAKLTGFSSATVSRVINQKPHVSEETRKKVNHAIKELNYFPSAYARGLSKNKTDIIGIVVPEISNPFFSEIIKGISSVTDKHQFTIILFNTDEKIENELPALRIIQEYRVRGLIITPVTGNNHYDKQYVELFENLNMPFIIVDREIKNGNFDGVYFDDVAAIHKATDLLIQNGHRDIGILVGNSNHIISQYRYQGYLDAFKANNLPLNKSRVYSGDFNIESAYNICSKLIKSNKLPTALVGINNMISLGCLKAIYENNLTIPNDISYVGYDSLEILNVLNLNLTLVEKDAVEMGRKAAEFLFDKINGNNLSSIKYILMPELIVRGSELLVSK